MLDSYKGLQGPNSCAPNSKQSIRVVSRGQIIFIPVIEVRFLLSKHKLMEIHTLVKTYYADDSLVRIESQLPNFIRINRNLLIAEDQISRLVSQKSRRNDLDWFVVTPFRERFKISRRETRSLKIWAMGKDLSIGRGTVRVKSTHETP